jgi:hypothetical protein
MATLGFSTQWPMSMGKGSTNFIPKIWKGLILNKYMHKNNILNFILGTPQKILDILPLTSEVLDSVQKIHTIRKDEKNLWKPGRQIHMVVFNRTKNRFQFAPVIEVKSVQKVEIGYLYIANGLYEPYVKVDGKILKPKQVKLLAQNDGFDSVNHFFDWFNNNFTGKIIHWTNLKY